MTQNIMRIREKFFRDTAGLAWIIPSTVKYINRDHYERTVI
jgi:hypothetical protein